MKRFTALVMASAISECYDVLPGLSHFSPESEPIVRGPSVYRRVHFSAVHRREASRQLGRGAFLHARELSSGEVIR